MSKHDGFSLIEIIISLAIISILLLGFDAMQLMILKETQSAYYFSVAEQQLINMSKRLALGKITQLEAELTAWNQQNQQLLPQGKGEIDKEQNCYSLVMNWQMMKPQTIKIKMRVH